MLQHQDMFIHPEVRPILLLAEEQQCCKWLLNTKLELECFQGRAPGMKRDQTREQLPSWAFVHEAVNLWHSAFTLEEAQCSSPPPDSSLVCPAITMVRAG